MIVFLLRTSLQRVLLKRPMDKGLYKVLGVVPNVGVQAISKSSFLTTSSVWHDRLGHVSQPIVNRVLKNCGISVASTLPYTSTCITYTLAKSHKLPFSSCHVKVKQYFDLWGPSPVIGNGDEKYFMLIVDDFSCFQWIFF